MGAIDKMAKNFSLGLAQGIHDFNTVVDMKAKAEASERARRDDEENEKRKNEWVDYKNQGWYKALPTTAQERVDSRFSQYNHDDRGRIQRKDIEWSMKTSMQDRQFAEGMLGDIRTDKILELNKDLDEMKELQRDPKKNAEKIKAAELRINTTRQQIANVDKTWDQSQKEWKNQAEMKYNADKLIQRGKENAARMERDNQQLQRATTAGFGRELQGRYDNIDAGILPAMAEAQQRGDQAAFDELNRRRDNLRAQTFKQVEQLYSGQKPVPPEPSATPAPTTPGVQPGSKAPAPSAPAPVARELTPEERAHRASVSPAEGAPYVGPIDALVNAGGRVFGTDSSAAPENVAANQSATAIPGF